MNHVCLTFPADMYHSFLKVFAVICPVHLVGSRLVKVVVVVRCHDAQTLFLLSIGALYQLKDNSADRRAVTHKFGVFQNVQKNRWFSAIIFACLWPDNKCGNSSRSHFGSLPSISPAGSLRFCHRLVLLLCWTESQNISPDRGKTTGNYVNKHANKYTSGKKSVKSSQCNRLQSEASCALNWS